MEKVLYIFVLSSLNLLCEGEFATFSISRNKDGDVLKALNPVACNQYNATQVNPTECRCVMTSLSTSKFGTLASDSKNNVNCLYEPKEIEGCTGSIVTKTSDSIIETIVDPIGTLRKSSGVFLNSCLGLSVYKVERWIGPNWVTVPVDDHHFQGRINVPPELAWRSSPDQYWTSKYAGNAIKVYLSCIKSDNSLESFCALTKIIGEKVYTLPITPTVGPPITSSTAPTSWPQQTSSSPTTLSSSSSTLSSPTTSSLPATLSSPSTSSSPTTSLLPSTSSTTISTSGPISLSTTTSSTLLLPRPTDLPTQTPPKEVTTPSTDKQKSNESSSEEVIAGVTTSALLLIAILLIFAFCWQRRKRKEKPSQVEEGTINHYDDVTDIKKSKLELKRSQPNEYATPTLSRGPDGDTYLTPSDLSDQMYERKTKSKFFVSNPLSALSHGSRKERRSSEQRNGKRESKKGRSGNSLKEGYQARNTDKIEEKVVVDLDKQEKNYLRKISTAKKNAEKVKENPGEKIASPDYLHVIYDTPDYNIVYTDPASNQSKPLDAIYEETSPNLYKRLYESKELPPLPNERKKRLSMDTLNSLYKTPAQVRQSKKKEKHDRESENLQRQQNIPSSDKDEELCTRAEETLTKPLDIQSYPEPDHVQSRPQLPDVQSLPKPSRPKRQVTFKNDAETIEMNFANLSYKEDLPNDDVNCDDENIDESLKSPTNTTIDEPNIMLNELPSIGKQTRGAPRESAESRESASRVDLSDYEDLKEHRRSTYQSLSFDRHMYSTPE